jgi:hypothetical protein
MPSFLRMFVIGTDEVTIKTIKNQISLPQLKIAIS